MSLLNDVLKDLDNRKNRSDDHSSIFSIPIGLSKPMPLDASKIQTFAILGIMAVIGMGYWANVLFVNGQSNEFMDLSYPSVSSELRLSANQVTPVLPLSADEPLLVDFKSFQFIDSPENHSPAIKDNVFIKNPLNQSSVDMTDLNKITSVNLNAASVDRSSSASIKDSMSDSMSDSMIEIKEVSKAPGVSLSEESLTAAQNSEPPKVFNIYNEFLLEQYDLLFLLNQLKSLYVNNADEFTKFFESQSTEIMLSEAQLLDLLGLLESFKHEQKKVWVHSIYDQLSVKSVQWGYWSFVYAVDLDRMKSYQKAIYFYKRALESGDISQRQRGLSRLRYSQLQSLLMN